MSRHEEIHTQLHGIKDNKMAMELKAEHDGLIKDEKFHTSPIVKAFHAGKPLVSYYGTQGRYCEFPIEVCRQYLPVGGTFSDPVGGSNTIPWEMKKLGYKVITNDRNYWSYCISKGIIVREEKLTDAEIESIVNTPCVEGYCCKHEPVSLNHPLAEYIDGVATANKDNYIALAVLGVGIVSTLTFRSMGWDKKAVKSIPVETFKKKLKDKLVNLNTFIHKGPECQAHFGDIFDYIAKPEVSGDTIYADPAWPWSDGRPVTEYGFFSMTVSSILRQVDVPKHAFWNKETVLPAVLDFTKKAKEKFKTFVLSTQSSNYPPDDIMRPALEKQFGKVEYLAYDVWSHAGARWYKELIYVF